VQFIFKNECITLGMNQVGNNCDVYVRLVCESTVQQNSSLAPLKCMTNNQNL
jgi:hypothetical protein